MKLTEIQIKILKIGVPVFCGLVVIAIIASIVISKKKATVKPTTEKPATVKPTTDTQAAAADLIFEKAKTAVKAFDEEIIKRDKAIELKNDTIELFYNVVKAAIVAVKETTANYNAQKTPEALSMNLKAMNDELSATAAFMKKYTSAPERGTSKWIGHAYYLKLAAVS